MAWRILVTAGTADARVTLYRAPEGRVWLRALARSELLHESSHDTVEAALLEAASRIELPHDLYGALMDAVEKQVQLGSLGDEPLPWKPSWPEDG